MPGNKKPRKKLRRVWAGLPKVFRHTHAADTMLKMIPHQELAKLRDGTADEGTWHTLTCRLDWGCFMSIDHFQNIEVNDRIRDALDAMVAIKERHTRLGKWGTTGDEFFKIGDALNLVDEMQKNTTRREQEDSLKAMLKLNNQLLKEQRK